MAAAMVPNPNVEDSRLCGQHQDMTVVTEHNAAGKPTEPVTPPPSDESSKGRDSHVSELSDLELEDEEEEEDIEPDHYYDGGKIPVFKPTMDQFRSFKKFVEKIDKFGMRSGIVKVIPPKEWLDALPALDEAVKTIRIKNPITQEFGGAHGTYTQANIEKQRSYNLPQWKTLTEESQHQPPARRGERRLNQEKPPRASPKSTSADCGYDMDAQRQPRHGRPSRKSQLSNVELISRDFKDSSQLDREGDDVSTEPQTPLTPTSPDIEPTEPERQSRSRPSLATSANSKSNHDVKRKSVKRTSTIRPKGSQAKTVAERRKYNQANTSKQVDEAAFEDFDYRFKYNNEFTKERCAELEEKYWKSLNFAPPMYGGDMPGSLFDDSTTSWNVAKLENLLDVLGQNIPGVNTTYLYLGMWKATFAWHLEDVDLYSINYIHFGAPKQWYSISQEDARRFENAMKSIWPQDAKSCSQFLRHKTYLISPDLLQKQFNIKVNKLVHHEGEFVITFPYGYHSGYNLGYNCAESVNFATESWLDYGRISKKCDCEADSVWVDVSEIERKLRGEPTPEFEEYTDDEDDFDDTADHLPSPPASVKGKANAPNRKRKRVEQTQGKKTVKKIKIRIRTASYQPCVLCPNHIASEPLLRTDNGKQAHRCCALYTPETHIVEEDGVQKVCNITNIDKARLELKCNFCRSKVGSCFQCSSRKCIRAYHATCAAAAGVQIDFGPTAVYGEDGTEYATEGYDFRCKFHRARRPKTITSDALEMNGFIRRNASAVKPGDIVQMQYLGNEVFAGVAVENRCGERMIVMDVLPDGDRVEVEWRFLCVLDPEDSQLPKPSSDAVPLPEHLSRQIMPDRTAEFGPPQEGDLFTDHSSINKWSEFHTAPAPRNRAQVMVYLSKSNILWHYLGETSTEARAHFTEDPTVKKNNPAGNYLLSVRHLLDSASAPRIPSKPMTKPNANWHAINAVRRQMANDTIHFHNRSLSTNQWAQPHEHKDLLESSSTQRKYSAHTPLQSYVDSFTLPQAAVQAPFVPPNPYTIRRGEDSRSKSAKEASLTIATSSSSIPRLGAHTANQTWVPQRSPELLISPFDRAREERLRKYPYLHKAFNERMVAPQGPQRAYRSPYTGEEGFSRPYVQFITQINGQSQSYPGTIPPSQADVKFSSLLHKEPGRPLPNSYEYQPNEKQTVVNLEQHINNHQPALIATTKTKD